MSGSHAATAPIEGSLNKGQAAGMRAESPLKSEGELPAGGRGLLARENGLAVLLPGTL